ncbi:MAG: cell surface protein [Opitutaceae bacterium]|nr:cell surface protein [Opitutaceae bacterium]
MHTNRISPARKITSWLMAAAGLALLSGCESVKLTDLTPKTMVENPSHIYTFTLRALPRTNTVVGLEPRIVIDGQNHGMKKSALGEGLYDFEYQLPPGRDRLAYYFLVNYNVEGNGVLTPQETYTQVSQVMIENRYVVRLQVNRGPVGAVVSIVGRGFTPQDTVHFDGTPVRTVLVSPNELNFFVPALDAGRTYKVTLAGSAGTSDVGPFRIDTSNVTVSPTSLTLRTGERQPLSFTLATPAPAGGTLLDVTTDVPESVIMPEVIVRPGQTHVSVTVEGGRPGNGNLFLKGFGSGEISIPITVNPR